ncbi:hypothetical protein MIND_01219800 [Mycena indigotica]|uniref:Mixed lineage kinase domain-containing protein n=1 Tax=Mycena indigotica TaxID=2126181 RepID=A0A8H6S3D4_9AGAR|nr:uncharacterized protein MIND_01219800 [Mycena indigotica]KAF7291943.1 hypothetical protein MIND_01219800 [Mycena indigotica]
MQIRRATAGDRALHYGGVTVTLLKDLGNASNQPYVQAVAAVAALVIETAQRVRSNKDACRRMTERAHELVGAVINIVADAQGALSAEMARSVEQFTDTLYKLLKFLRSQVRGSLVRRMLRATEDAELIAECTAGLKHALDVFSVQSGIIAAKTMAAIQKEGRTRHEEIVSILKEKKASRKSKRSVPADAPLPPGALLPASPKIFHGRAAELAQLVDTLVDPKAPPPITIPAPAPRSPWGTWSPSTPGSPGSYRALTASTLARPSTPPPTPATPATPPAPPGPARVAICGPPGIGKTALALAAAHDARVAAMFGARRFFVECDGAADAQALVACVGQALGLEEARRRRKYILKFLGGEGAGKTGMARSGTTDSGVSADSDATLADPDPDPAPEPERGPVLLILDGLEGAWKPPAGRGAVEDLLGLLVDVPRVTLLVTLRGHERPRHLKWTRPFLAPLKPLPPAAARAAFLDVSDVPEDDADLPRVLAQVAQGNARRVAVLAGLASFEGCAALMRRWEAEGEGMLLDRVQPTVLGGVVYDEPESFGDEEALWAVLDPTSRDVPYAVLGPDSGSDADSGASTPALSRSSSSSSTSNSSLDSAFASSASTAPGSIFSAMFTPSRSSSKESGGRYPSIDSVLRRLPSPPSTPPRPWRKESEATPAALARLGAPALAPPTPAPASMIRLAGLVPPTRPVV